MIKFTYTKGSGALCYGFGISEENVKRLKKGQPIYIDLSQIGGTGEVMIFYGKTEQDMARDLAEFIGPDTVTHIDPKVTDCGKA